MQDMQASVADTISKRGFAELLGVSPGRVSQMIKAGLIVEPNGRIEIDKGKAWVTANIDSNRRRVRLAGEGAPIGTSKATRDAAEAEIAGLKAGKLAEKLIDKQATLRAIETRARFERDAWIGWVNRAAPEIATATGGDLAAVVAALDRMVRDQLATRAGTASQGIDP
jgi:hypothetical protein